MKANTYRMHWLGWINWKINATRANTCLKWKEVMKFFFKHTRDMSNLVPGISVVDLFVLMIMSHI